ncbi:MAG: hypothetical protein QM770_08295 [Tepidisphaeraceae bacterium]
MDRAQILALLNNPQSAVRNPQSLGADVDATPILDRSKPIVLNDTDEKRAAIVQRYRLMSGQPDEFIQFKALAEMAGRSGLQKLDPRLYQYGGLWIYPVGALLKACSTVGLVELKADRAYYLDHPEQFGKFYVVARAYSATWGVIAVLCVYWITKRTTVDRMLAVLAACAFAVLPVVTTATHEAKPHLAGATLVLLASIAATKFVETKRAHWAMVASILCGAAPAMVLSMVWAITLLAVMWIMAWHGRPARGSNTGETPVPRKMSVFAMTLFLAAATYAVTNPFVIVNALFHREYLTSNLGNSTAMYGVRDLPKALLDATRIFSLGATPVVLVGGILGTIVVLWNATRSKRSRRACSPSSSEQVRRLPRADEVQSDVDAKHDVPDPAPQDAYSNARSDRVSMVVHRDTTPLLLLALPTLLTLLTFIALAAGKPAEYARFGLLVAAAAVVVFAAGLTTAKATWSQQWMRWGNRVSVCAVAFWIYTSFIFYVVDVKTLLPWQERLRSFRNNFEAATDTPFCIGLHYEPAPWSTPPLDLWNETLVLLARQVPADEVAVVTLWPANLESQVGMGWGHERVSWASNRYAVGVTKKWEQVIRAQSMSTVTQRRSSTSSITPTTTTSPVQEAPGTRTRP